VNATLLQPDELSKLRYLLVQQPESVAVAQLGEPKHPRPPPP
jgi:hypothetical protein